MASINTEIPLHIFNLIKIKVADYSDDHKSLSMFKVLFGDHVKPQELSKIKDTMGLLSALITSSDLSCQDITILCDTIKLTRHISLQNEIKDILPSFPDVNGVAISKFDIYRQKLMQFGMELTEKDVTKIDGIYNEPKKNYTDSWAMIYHLEDQQIIKKDTITDFIKTLKVLKLFRALEKLEKLTEESTHCDGSVTPKLEESNMAMPEPAEENFNQLLKDVSGWWEEYGNVDMLKVLISEFNNHHKTITLDTIQAANTPYQLFSLLMGSGLINKSKINILVEATVLCGLQGVEDVVRAKVKLPNFSELPIRIFSEHRQQILRFGHEISREHKVQLGQLYGIRASKETDPWVIIFKLEHKGKLTEGEPMKLFIKKLEDNTMFREANALKN